MALAWHAMLWSRPLKIFFMSPEDWVRTGCQVAASFGVTDAQVLAFRGTGTAFTGVTDVSVFPPQHVLLENAGSVAEALHWSTLSQRTFPFYCFPGRHAGMVLLDGCFSAHFSVPHDADPAKVIRISPFPLPDADVVPRITLARPRSGPGPGLPPRALGRSWASRAAAVSRVARDLLYTRYATDILRHMTRGYEAAADAHGTLVAKGLREKRKPPPEKQPNPSHDATAAAAPSPCRINEPGWVCRGGGRHNEAACLGGAIGGACGCCHPPSPRNEEARTAASATVSPQPTTTGLPPRHGSFGELKNREGAAAEEEERGPVKKREGGGAPLGSLEDMLRGAEEELRLFERRDPTGFNWHK